MEFNGRRRSSGASMREWRRTGYEASGGCSGAGEARNCGCAATEAADDGEQRARWWSGGVLSGGEAEEAKCGRMSGAAWLARERTARRR
jgi:hypothetical protein